MKKEFIDPELEVVELDDIGTIGMGIGGGNGASLPLSSEPDDDGRQ